jgi:hypothetical protein
MAFLPTSTTQTLYAYLTQKGREYVFTGNKEQFQITQFTLHDNDINYYIAKNLVNLQYNKLPRGFVPDITGDNDDCVLSVALGVHENLGSIITGTTSSTLRSTRDLFLSFNAASYTAPAPGDNVLTFNDFDNIQVLLTPPTNDINPLTEEEIQKTTFRVTATFANQYVKNIKINGSVNQSPLLAFPNTTGVLPINLSFEKNVPVGTPSQTVQAQITLDITNESYATLNQSIRTFNYYIPLKV